MPLPSKLIAFSTFLSLVAACATADESAGSTEGAIHTAAGVCATLDYGHTATVADFYRKFESDAAAADFMTKLIARGELASNSGPNAKLKEITSDPHLLGLVSEAFEGFKKAFPQETVGMTDAPRVAIIETDIVNAFALGPGFVDTDDAPKDKAPWLFIVHTALLDKNETDDALRGLFAHELGHLLLRNFLPETRQKIRADYVVKASEDGVIGSDQDNDPHAQGHIEQVLKLRDRVGGVPELGFPVIQTQGSYAKLFSQLALQVVKAAPDPTKVCTGLAARSDALMTAQKALVPGIPAGNFTPRKATADEQANLDKLGDEVATELRSCLAALPDEIKNTSLLELIAGLNNMDTAVDPANPDHQKLLDLMLPQELKVDAESAGAPLVDRLIKAQAAIRSDLLTLQSDPAFPIDQLRVFDFEEDADDASARVLAALGRDPLGASAFLLTVLPADLRQQCQADVAADKPISYGRFIDPHPTICWRFYHNTQLAKALAQCTAPASGKTRTGGGAPSVADKAPTETVEKGYGRGLY